MSHAKTSGLATRILRICAALILLSACDTEVSAPPVRGTQHGSLPHPRSSQTNP